MKKLIISSCLAVVSFGAFAQEKTILLSNKKVLPALNIKAMTFKNFVANDFKLKNGVAINANAKTKTISGKEILVSDYLLKLNNVEKKLNAKGNSLRTFGLANSIDKRKVKVIEEKKVLEANKITAPSMAKELSLTDFAIATKYHKTEKLKSLSVLLKNGLLKGQKNVFQGVLGPKNIEQVVDLKTVLKTFSDKIADSENADDFKSKFNINASQVKVTSVFIPPTDNSFNLETTNSKFTVNTSFNAGLNFEFYGIPVEVNLINLTGEFEANAKNGVKNKRRVVVNYAGRSIINKTSTLNADELDEDFVNALNISELTNFPTDLSDFIPYDDFIPIHLSFSTLGSIGAQYSVDMSKTHVDATVGPTYAIDLRVSASYGIEDILEGGIEGIITIARGSLGFGGNAGIDVKPNNKCKLINKMKVTAGLDVLQGEVNLFTKYPDLLGSWDCGEFLLPLPCIKKDTYPIYKTPVAFKVRGTLIEKDKSEDLN